MFDRVRGWLRRASAFLRSSQHDRDLADELAAHLQLHIDDNMRLGMTPEEARRQATLKLGGIDPVMERVRDRRGLPFLDVFGRDLKYAIRFLRHSPGFTAVAILSLALGIGANSAIFSLVDSLLLRSLPVDRPDRLVEVVAPTPSTVRKYWPYPVWEQVRDRPDLFAGTLAWSHHPVNLAPRGEMRMVDAVLVSGRFFDVLGIHPTLGRLLTPADDRAGGGADGQVVVISYSFWQSRFNGSGDAIGQTLPLNGVPFTIVGIMPEGFFGPSVGAHYSLAAPLTAQPLLSPSNDLANSTASWLAIMARLKHEQSAAAASAALQAAQLAIRQATLPATLTGYLKEPLIARSAPTGVDSPMRVQYQTPVVALLAVVALVLLIACVNLASLFQARADARRHELGVRLALGASRARLVRQLIIESLLLSFAGASLGLAVAVGGSRLILTQLIFQGSGIFLDVSLNRTVIGFTTAVSILVALLFGTLPAIRATNVSPRSVLVEPSRTGGGQIRPRRFGMLTTLQVALCLILVVGAGMFLRSFVILAHLDPGFDQHAVLVVNVTAGQSRVGLAADVREAVLDAVRATPGVTSAAWSRLAPLNHAGLRVLIANPPELAVSESERLSQWNGLDPGWLSTMGTRLVAGRDFDAHDRAGTPSVAIVNETFAQRFFPSGTPLGRTIVQVPPPGFPARPPSVVIGVVEDAAYESLRDDAKPTVYQALAQGRPLLSVATLCIRATNGSAAAVIRDVALALSNAAPDLQFTFHTMEDLAGESLAVERILAMLSGFFGALALLVAAIGLYGVVSYAVNRRRAEIGIRMALGAQPAGIVRMILTGIGPSMAAGLVAGIVLSVWLARFVRALLYRIQPGDALNVVSAAAVLTAVGLLAAWLPARRAAQLDPMEALREQ
jgi:putative ABC transport system permease protein